jgi:hypothetical protein
MNGLVVNIKPSLVVMAIAAGVFSLVVWLAKGKIEGVDRQLSRQWQKINALEKAACAAHPQHCPE